MKIFYPSIFKLQLNTPTTESIAYQLQLYVVNSLSIPSLSEKYDRADACPHFTKFI